MSDIVERLRGVYGHSVCQEAATEIEHLRADKAAISQTASDYLHEIERLHALDAELLLAMTNETQRVLNSIKSTLAAPPFAKATGAQP